MTLAAQLISQLTGNLVRAIFVSTLFLGLSGCQTVAPHGGGSYIGLTKRELAGRLGIPSEIKIVTEEKAPTWETWSYYWQDQTGKIQVADFFFDFQGRVSSASAFFEPRGLLHSDSPADFRRIYRYKSGFDR